MPSQNVSDIDVFHFIGEIKEIEEVSFDRNRGFIFNVKLINDEEDENFFSLNIFVNKENLKINTPEIGMKITGGFWLQGYINLKKSRKQQYVINLLISKLE